MQHPVNLPVSRGDVLRGSKLPARCVVETRQPAANPSTCRALAERLAAAVNDFLTATLLQHRVTRTR